MRLRKLNLEERPPVLLAASGIVSVAPMAVYRLLQGNYVAAAIDTLAVLCALGVVLVVYVKRAAFFASVALAVVAMTATVATVHIGTARENIWLHPTLVGLFYLLGPRLGAYFSIVLLGLALPALLAQGNSSQVAVNLMSLLYTLCLSLAFSSFTAQQRSELKVQSRRDALTGAGNRRALEERLDSVMADVAEATRPFHLIMLDIDHFKTINDRFGHSAGDAVLRTVAATITSNIRATDTFFRAGGEEFVVVADTGDLAVAMQLGERLRSAIEIACTTIPGHAPVTVTASLGLAEYQSGDTRDSLCKRADDALYQAKRAGRNRLQLSARLAKRNAA